MGNRDQVLHLKTQREWHTGKRMDEPILPTSISNSWILPFIRAPKSFLWFCTSLGLSPQAESSQSHQVPSSSLRSFPLHKGAPASTWSAGCSLQHLHLAVSHAHSHFLSFLSEKVKAVSSLEANRTLLQSLMVT